jgi:hypothetical protein
LPLHWPELPIWKLLLRPYSRNRRDTIPETPLKDSYRGTGFEEIDSWFGFSTTVLPISRLRDNVIRVPRQKRNFRFARKNEAAGAADAAAWVMSAVVDFRFR